MTAPPVAVARADSVGAAHQPIRQSIQPAAFEPYIPPEAHIPELTVLPLILGTLLGAIFGASSLYLVLKVGLTVSASIPVAVISITLFRLFSKMGGRDATILENNIVQTAGSAGESIAFGLGVTMPAIMILGFDLEIARVALVAVLGGLLGILMMIPLRRALIVHQHGILKYPEGTACAEVLKAGASAESRAASSASAKREHAALGGAATSATTIFTGFGVGLAYKALNVALKGWKDVPQKIFGAPFAAGSISAEISPELLGVGYIIGPRIASMMCAGGVLAYLVLIPAIKFFGSGLTTALAPGTVPISQMGPDEIRGAYILYIGAGAVAAGGIISLLRSLPTIWSSMLEGLKDFRGGAARAPVAAAHRARSVDEGGGVRQPRARRRDHAGPAAAHERGGRRPDRRARLSVRDRLVAADRRDRIVVEPDFGHDRGDAAAHVSGLRAGGLDRARLLRHGALGRGDRLHRLLQRRHDLAGSQDRLPGRRDAPQPADRDRDRRAGVGAGPRPDPAEAERRGHGSCAAHQQGAGGRRRWHGPARRRKFLGPAARGSGHADRPGNLSGRVVSRLVQTDDRRTGRRAKYLVDAGGTPVYPGRPRHQRRAPLFAGRAARRGEVRRAQGDA